MADRERALTIDRHEPHDLPSLLERLAQDVATLVEQKVALLRVEVKEEIDAYVRGSIALLAGAIVAGVGFALTNIALAFAIAALFANSDLSQPARYALGFVITGLLYLVIGAIVIIIARGRLAHIGLVPRRTVKELQRDKEWIKKEV